MPGILISRALSCPRPRRSSSSTVSPDSTDSAVRAPTPLILSSWRNACALRLGGEAVQQMRILAHQQMGVQRDLRAGRGQLVEGAHRHVDLVADALHVDQHLRRMLLENGARTGGRSHEPPVAHPNTRRWQALPRPCPPCAWQIAHASASAASALGSPGSCSSRRTISCTCSLRGVAIADHRLLHLQRRVFGHRQAAEHRGADRGAARLARAAASIAD